MGTTMRYSTDGYDLATKEWNPAKPLDDYVLPSLEWLEQHEEWLVNKPRGYDYIELRDAPFAIMSFTSIIIPVLFGRLDVFLEMAIMQFFLCGFKIHIGFTWQTPPAPSKCLAVFEVGGEEKMNEFREAYLAFPGMPNCLATSAKSCTGCSHGRRFWLTRSEW